MVVGLRTTYANKCLSPLQFESRSWQGVLETTLCDKVCQCLAASQWFSPGTQVSSTSKTDCQDITEILLKVVLNTITLTLFGNGLNKIRNQQKRTSTVNFKSSWESERP